MKYLCLLILFWTIPVNSATSTLDLNTIFQQEANLARIPVSILRAVCWVESRHAVKAIKVWDNGPTAVGICQVKRKTGKFVGIDDIRPVRMNIRAASRYLAWQYERYGDWDKAIVAYNRGHFKRRNWYLIQVKFAMREKR